ncbi:MAG: hypothetical protein ACFFDH_13235 [Promethearchaeota archaeon]
MIYNLIVLDIETGVSISTIRLSEEGIDENQGILMAGVVKAIKDFLENLQFGRIKEFHTHDKKVIIGKRDRILAALVCDNNVNVDLFYPKINNIANLFYSAYNWEIWDGGLNIFDEIKHTAKQILTLTEKEIISHLFKSLKIYLSEFSEIYGFKIFHNYELKEQFFKKIDDFEISTFLTSDFFKNLEKNQITIIDIISGLINKEELTESYLNYGRFSIYSKSFFGDMFVILLLPGGLNPLSDLPKYQKKLDLIVGEI